MTKRALILWTKKSATNLGLQVLAGGAERLCEMAFGDVSVDFHDHSTVGTPLNRAPILRDAGRRSGPIKSLFRSYDLILDTGSGDSFTDIYGAKRLAMMTYGHRAAVASGVPLVLTPQTIGPFDNAISRQVARMSLRGAARVYTRDSKSAEYSTWLGRKPDSISSDLVFALPPVSPGCRDGLYLNVSGLLWRPNPHVDHLQYRAHVVGTARAMAAQGLSVTLFAHVLRRPTSREDDVTPVEEAARQLGGQVETFIPSSLEDARTRLASAVAVVGARMHACLNALSVGTPSLAWAYSRKAAPLLSDLGWDATVDLRESVDIVASTADFIHKLDSWNARCPEIRERGRDSIEKVAADLAALV